jgi:two-component system CheB/CheR fusion protein
MVDLEILPLKPRPRGRPDCFLVLFIEPAPPGPVARKEPARRPAVDDKLAKRMRQELTATREYLQSIIEDHERTNQELQSANEEILSGNEELQSTNEELETAREELQSINEELTTVNDELHLRNAELTQLNNDLVNLLNSAHIPILMLGPDLRIRRCTPQTSRVFNVIPSDVGRPLSDLRPNLIVPGLEQLITEVMDTLAPREIEVQDRDGRWCSLRIRPYKTVDNKIDGVVIALVDIDSLKRSAADVREARDLAEAVVQTVRHPLLVLDAQLRVKTANRAFYDQFQTRPDLTENRFLYSLGAGEWNVPKLRELLENLLPRDTRFDGFEIDVEVPGSTVKRLVLNACQLSSDGPQSRLILLAMEERRPA